LFPEDEKTRTAAAIAGALGQCRKEIIERQLCHFYRADPGYGARVAAALGVQVNDGRIVEPAVNSTRDTQPVS
jgi:catalase